MHYYCNRNNANAMLTAALLSSGRKESVGRCACARGSKTLHTRGFVFISTFAPKQYKK
jgi:hypothetical protein